MRSWQVAVLGEPRDVVRPADIDVPVPGPGEIRLAVRAAALSLPDALMCHGTYAFSPPLPFVPGQEVCGVVDEVGAGVDVARGARLMAVTSFFDGRGGLADFAIARAESCYRVPDEMDDLTAASLRIGFGTAWIGLVRRAALRPGDRVLVLGAAGGTGIAAVQLARALGASVIAVASGPEKAALCARLGADVVIDRSTQDVVPAVLDATAGRGVDVVYDPVGGRAAGATVGCLAPGGRLLAVGFASGSWVEADIWELVRRHASIVGVYAGGLRKADNDADHEALLELIASGRLRAVTSEVPFASVPEALDAIGRGAALGKLVTRVAAVA
jgi:NADPH2:quinone reductase